jgi:hypothetical protein
MSVITRRFSACPVRTAAQTWNVIVKILSDHNQKVEQELNRICGISSSLIAEGTPKSDAITIIGTGPRLRIYCLYDEDGSVEDANEALLNWNLFERDDWQIWLPVGKSDLDWVSAALRKEGSRFKAYETGSKIDDSEDDKASNPIKTLSIDIEKLKSHG